MPLYSQCGNCWVLTTWLKDCQRDSPIAVSHIDVMMAYLPWTHHECLEKATLQWQLFADESTSWAWEGTIPVISVENSLRWSFSSQTLTISYVSFHPGVPGDTAEGFLLLQTHKWVIYFYEDIWQTLFLLLCSLPGYTEMLFDSVSCLS